MGALVSGGGAQRVPQERTSPAEGEAMFLCDHCGHATDEPAFSMGFDERAFCPNCDKPYSYQTAGPQSLPASLSFDIPRRFCTELEGLARDCQSHSDAWQLQSTFTGQQIADLLRRASLVIGCLADQEAVDKRSVVYLYPGHDTPRVEYAHELGTWGITSEHDDGERFSRVKGGRSDAVAQMWEMYT